MYVNLCVPQQAWCIYWIMKYTEALCTQGHSKLNSCLSGYLLKKIGSVGRLEKENESMNIIIKWA